MGGITSTGLFSGIDSASLIEQLLAVEARPRTLAQARIAQLQTQQAAYLDINSRLSAFASSAAAFRTGNVFDTKTAASSDDSVLGATASTGAQEGSYSFLVDRLVSTRQLLSKGFSDLNTGAFGASEFRFEDRNARLDRDAELSELNGGAGVQRGTIRITDRDGNTADVDLSRAGTVNEVLDAINDTAGLNISATVVDNAIYLNDSSTGAGSISVTNLDDNTTAEDLGLATDTDGGTAAVLEGSQIWSVTASTALDQLNDGRGVGLTDLTGSGAADLVFDIGGEIINVNLGQLQIDDDGDDETPPVDVPRVTTLGGAIDRINQAIADKAAEDGATFDGQVEARLAADGLSIEVVDLSGARDIAVTSGTRSTAARDLGLDGDGTGGTLAGSRLIAGLNSTLLSSLGGRDGLTLSGTLDFTTSDGILSSVDVSNLTSVSELVQAVNTGTGGRVVASLNETGTGLQFTDTTEDSAATFSVAGAAASQLSLGASSDGVIDSGNLQKAYIGEGSLLANLNAGKGLGTGTIEFVTSTGERFEINITENDRTIGDIINKIEVAGDSRGIDAQINANGDGIDIIDNAGGSLAISIADTSGNVASLLGLEGEFDAAETGPTTVTGSFERVVTFDADDTLEDAVRKINEAGVQATATIINDGSNANPYRISIVSRESGKDGRFVFDSGGFDLGLQSLDEGNDARVFFGSSDPAKAVLLTSSSNTLDEAIQGVTIDLKQASDDVINLTVTKTTAEVESTVEGFVDAFNELIDRIDFQTRFISETEERGPLIGDSTSQLLRGRVFAAIQGTAQDIDGRYQRLSDVGIRIGDGGRLTFDRDQFRDALSEDPDAVEALLAEREVTDVDTTIELEGGVTVSNPDGGEVFGALGLPALIEQLAEGYTDSIDGLFTIRSNAIDTQIESQEGRIDSINLRLEQRRSVLQGQFLAMEQAIASLQTQQASLGQIQSIG
ncbi:MAG: flagellar filament capping protein FliD [Planctomycetota bacterium]